LHFHLHGTFFIFCHLRLFCYNSSCYF
jgi:hypothetical protein